MTSMAMKIYLNANEKALTTLLLESELQRVKNITPAPQHRYAVEEYKKRLVRFLKKMNPKGRYWI